MFDHNFFFARILSMFCSKSLITSSGSAQRATSTVNEAQRTSLCVTTMNPPVTSFKKGVTAEIF